ncbi:MAG: PTS transporter subunit EIIC [Clostridium sp.]|uniref:PTS transporter subunit EIIC n=1 Tax=Clostridium sp. TaxID=1506 RepID=UPI0029090E6C|nr:PTS transporter subunit EIIC [Clostridium sp.]MDU5109549.1 PTS transporter subunit EIIC [Clostridium sp.]
MDTKVSIAVTIVEALGGVSNIKEFENCMTRLRVAVKDPAKVDRNSLSRIDGVLKVVGSDTEIQVVLGPGVAENVSDELKNMEGLNYTEIDIDNPIMTKKNAGNFFEFLAKVFTPLVPVFAGSGLLFGLMKIFTLIYNLNGAQIFNPAAIADGGSVFMAALSVLASTFFTYLNIAVAMQAAKVMGGNPFLGLVAGGIISSVGALNGTAMGIGTLTFANGRGGVLSALCAGALIAIVEKWVKKRVPNALRVHTPSLVAIAVVGLASLYVLQPIGGLVTDWIATILLWVFENFGPLGGAIISATFLPLVMTGLHHGLTPVHATLIQEVGYTSLYGYQSFAGAGQVGAAIALYFKYRQQKKLREAINGGLPAGILGIGEPLIFGVTLPLGRAFATACLGAAFGGLVAGFFPGFGAETISVSGLLGTLVNTRPIVYLLGYLVAIAGGFILTWAIGVKKGNLESFGSEK